MRSGIYKIINTVTCKFYIGSAVNLSERWRFGHLRSLELGKHKNIRLQNSYNKHGKEAFSFEVLEYCSKERLIEREQHYLDTLLFAQEYIEFKDSRFEKLGYNISPTAGNVLGKRCSESTKQKLSLINKGKPNPKNSKPKSEETKRKISETLKGHKRSPESINKQADKVRGVPKSLDHIEKVRQANIGKKRSKEDVENMSIIQKKHYQDNPQRRIDRSIKQKEVMANMSEEWHRLRNQKISQNHRTKQNVRS